MTAQIGISLKNDQRKLSEYERGLFDLGQAAVPNKVSISYLTE